MKEHIDSFWQKSRYAVVGVSSSGKGFGSSLYTTLKSNGYEVYPVNANADTVMGDRCYRSLGELPERPEAVFVVVPPASSTGVVRECAQLGVKNVWLQQGAESEESIKAGEEKGLALVHHQCAMMYMPGTAFPHRFHRFFKELFSAPR